jgi:lipid A 3-O-deacylase
MGQCCIFYAGYFPVKRAIFLFLLLQTASCLLYAESRPEGRWLRSGKWEFALWSGGGTAFNGSTKDTQMLASGIRFAKLLRPDKEEGSFPGSLQYAMEVLPVFVVFQENTVYGAEVTPFLLKWNFAGTRKRVFPYFIGGAGMLYTNSDVPAGTSRFNFTPQGGLGVSMTSDRNRAIAFEFCFMHISNGGFQSPNPGINSIQFHIGYEWIH